MNLSIGNFIPATPRMAPSHTKRVQPQAAAHTGDSVRFSGNPQVGTDAEAKAILANIRGRLADVTDWSQKTIVDRYGQMPIGDDLMFKLDGVSYTFRDVFSTEYRDDDTPGGPEVGASLIADSPQGTKTYTLSYSNEPNALGTYQQNYRALANVAYAQFTETALARLKANPERIKDIKTNTRVPFTIFHDESRHYTYIYDKKRQTHTLRESAPMPPDDIVHQFHDAATRLHQATGEADRVVPFEDYKKGIWGRLYERPLPLTVDQAKAVCGMLRISLPQ